MKQLLKKLIEADSTAQSGELATAEIICRDFSRLGIDSSVDIWDQNRANITAQIRSSGSRPGLLFACHLDVVESGRTGWTYPPFSAVETGGRVYGRGSVDMKGPIAAVVTAISQVIESGVGLAGDIVFFAAAGEETDSCGTRRFMRDCGSIGRLAGVVIPEPTGFEVVTAHRGLLWLKVTTKGRAVHGSTPQLGVNAIASMTALLGQLENHEIRFEPHKRLGGCSMSVNTIAGGREINVVPDACEIGIDIRTLPGQNHRDIIDDFEGIFAELKQRNSQFEAGPAIVRDVGALETDESCDFVKDFCAVVGTSETKAVGFCTDGPFFEPLAAPVVVFGPGRPELCHRPDEYIDFSDVEKAVEYYKKIILGFLS